MLDLTVSAIAYEEDGIWVIQGIEYDIVAHAQDPANLPYAFMKAIVENVCITEHLGRLPLQGIRPAPARFKEMFDKAYAQLSAVADNLNPQVGKVDIRLAARAA